MIILVGFAKFGIHKYIFNFCVHKAKLQSKNLNVVWATLSRAKSINSFWVGNGARTGQLVNFLFKSDTNFLLSIMVVCKC